MRGLNRNRGNPASDEMQGWSAIIFCLLAATLSGCMQTTAPGTELQAALDALAYGRSAAAPVVRAAYGATPARASREAGFRLDAGDKVRVLVYGEQGISTSYAIDT